MDNEKVHICHLVYSFNIGGLERVIANCINALGAEHYQHTIIALTKVGDFVDEIKSEVNTHSLHKRGGNDVSLYFNVHKLLQQLSPDVLHTYNLPTIEYQLVGALCGVPLRIHAEHGRDSYDSDGSSLKYKILRRALSPMIHQFVAVSEDLRDWLNTEVGVPARKLNLICNGVDTELFKNELAHQLASDSSSFVFGHVARLHSIKNQLLLLKGFEGACRESRDFREQSVLIIVGDGPDKEKLQAMVNCSELLVDRVKFSGEQTDVRRFYQMFDVFVMTSIAEGIPMTLIEAMSMKLPHIVTGVGGINEVVKKDVTGFVIESYDERALTSKMLAMFHNQPAHALMGDRARERVVEQYSQKNMVENYATLYRKVEA